MLKYSLGKAKKIIEALRNIVQFERHQLRTGGQLECSVILNRSDDWFGQQRNQ